ncbi:hypothetical protein [Bradyrhizobium sp. AUGA SZCCT0182]|uniref:hypothetical protein n=1 Tax=Bradyrhizobium sp. AUGA SZCCT0182 TaxID=2807667 RepID=UPI001BA976FE|nr:hypothetical protein [Bradyrhizobium sp. AUGA SZCCT0182]MBR1237379.1 hypothetical protein [Bradyrhizobium sp. AUGA SZCCT0182]
MLNDADGHGAAGDGARGAVEDADAVFSKLKRWVKTDRNSKGQVNWRREAREDSTLRPANSSTAALPVALFSVGFHGIR